MRIKTSKMKIFGLANLFLLLVVSLYGTQGQGIYNNYVYIDCM